MMKIRKVKPIHDDGNRLFETKVNNALLDGWTISEVIISNKDRRTAMMIKDMEVDDAGD